MTIKEKIEVLNELKSSHDLYEELNPAEKAAFNDAIEALKLVDEFERADIITGGRLNGRTQAYKCGFENGKRQAAKDWEKNFDTLTSQMRDATPEENQAIDNYIRKNSINTGINVFDLWDENNTRDKDKDLVSRKEVLDVIQNNAHRYTLASEFQAMGTVEWSAYLISVVDARKLIQDLPRVFTKMDDTGDAISREYVLPKLERLKELCCGDKEALDLIAEVKHAPTVSVEKSSHWIYNVTSVICSQCGKSTEMTTGGVPDRCPYCGARQK